MKAVWMNTMLWLAAVLAALVLAFAAPSESDVMGRLPALMAKRLDQRPVSLPAGLPSERTLALVIFSKSQHHAIESWIQGLQLYRDPSIAWVKMPVLNDPGDTASRSAIENRLLARYPNQQDRAHMLPLFTDRAAFIRSAGLSGPENVYALVINRNGEVLARAEGQFDEDKAQALRETLLKQGY